MKKFFGEFKKFITRGNVLDMAVGVIVGGAFTAIVNALSNNILKPLINAVLRLILGANSLSEIYTFLHVSYVDGTTFDAAGKVLTGGIDLANSIFIDWGAFINAIINFFIIAFVLFLIVRTINRVKERNEEIKGAIAKNKLSKEDKKELKARGISRSDREAVKAYLAEKEAIAQQEAERIKAEEEAKAAQDRIDNPTTEDLLKDIKRLLELQLNGGNVSTAEVVEKLAEATAKTDAE